MFKALLKKQLMEVNTWLLQDKKKGTARTKQGILLLIILYTALFGMLGAMFFNVGKSFCGPLCLVELDWLYFAIMSLLSVILGVFGSVFNTYTTLYEAKDNELLLSMPIRPGYILTVRVLGVYLWSFIYVALVFIPAILVYQIYGEFRISALISSVLLLFVLSLFVLVLSCVLGWVVAKISGKLKNKSYVTVLVSLLFIGLYYFFYFVAMENLKEFLSNAATIGAQIKGKVLPVYWLGNAGNGAFGHLLLIAVFVAALMAAVFYIMNRSFIRMATAGNATTKKKYIRTRANRRSVGGAFFFKELRRFTSSANYMLNCGLGTLFLPIIGVAALVKMDWIHKGLTAMQFPAGLISLMLCAGMCVAASMNDITGPSVSLEGKHLWIAQSLPVSAWCVLKAKLKLHLVITEIPVAFCAVCLGIAVRQDLLSLLLCLVVPMVFVVLNAMFGLFINLKMPNLTWTNEVVPIKQSLATMVALFGGWVFVFALGVLYIAVHEWVTESAYLLLCGALMVLLCAMLYVWLKGRGSRIFAEL